MKLGNVQYSWNCLLYTSRNDRRYCNTWKRREQYIQIQTWHIGNNAKIPAKLRRIYHMGRRSRQDVYKRQALINEAQQLVDTGKLEEFKVKKQEIESLDNQFDAEAKATAELETLNKQPVIDLQNLSTPVTGEVTDQLNFEVKNEETGVTNRCV